jgi:uncharacterized protein (DUF1499 family)
MLDEQPSREQNNIHRLALCPKTPNCVSSLDTRSKYFVDPFIYTGSLVDARNSLLTVLESFQRSRINTAEENYIHAEFKSLLFRFADDVEFLLMSRKKEPTFDRHLEVAIRTSA